jgi:hypothetical protein
VREELPNGGANWRLACGERRCVVTLAMGEKRREKEASTGFFLFIGEGEREGGVSWSRPSAIAGRRLAGAAGPLHASGPLCLGH